jgi:hypothetical protein
MGLYTKTDWLICEIRDSQQGHEALEHGSRGCYGIGSRYQETGEDLVVNSRVCEFATAL